MSISRIIREHLSYDADSGMLFWVKASGSRRFGDLVDRFSSGYLVVNVKGKKFKAHRLAWFLHYGEWPKGQIDHRNGARSDNRIGNLRLATNSQNQQNCGKRKKKRGTLKGAYPERDSGKWRAQIRANGKVRYLGIFATEIKAARAYDAAARKHFGEFARLNFPEAR